MVRKQCALSSCRAMNRKQSYAQCETRMQSVPCLTNCRLSIAYRWQVNLARILSTDPKDNTMILPRLHPTVTKDWETAVLTWEGLRAERVLSVISESKCISGRGRKAKKVGVWLSGWFYESRVCCRAKDYSILLLLPSILTLKSYPFSTSMQQMAGSCGQERTCLMACAFSGGQKKPTSILFRSFFLKSAATICRPILESKVSCKARVLPSVSVLLSTKATLLSTSAINSMVFPKVSSPSYPFWVANALRWSTNTSCEYSPQKLQTLSNSKVSSDHRQSVRSLAAEIMTLSSSAGTIFSTCLAWQLQEWIMIGSAAEFGESGNLHTFTFPLMSPVMVYLQLLLKCTYVIAASFFTNFPTAERSYSRGREQKLMFWVDQTQSRPSPRSYPQPLFHERRDFSSTARNSPRSMPNRTLDRNFVSFKLVRSSTLSVSTSITPTSKKTPSDSIYSKPTEYLLSQSDSRAMSSRFLLKTQSFQSLHSTIKTPNDGNHAQLMMDLPYHPTEACSRWRRCPSKQTRGQTRWTVARRMARERKVGSTESYPFISSYKWRGDR